MVHTSYQFPNAGDGIWLKSERGRRLNIMISPVITVTSSRVKDLSVTTRGCVFPDERELYIYHVYTQSSCLIQCRMEYILDTCGCHMYFFIIPGESSVPGVVSIKYSMMSPEISKLILIDLLFNEKFDFTLHYKLFLI